MTEVLIFLTCNQDVPVESRLRHRTIQTGGFCKFPRSTCEFWYSTLKCATTASVAVIMLSSAVVIREITAVVRTLSLSNVRFIRSDVHKQILHVALGPRTVLDPLESKNSDSISIQRI
jgi:hypothetical protein